MNSLLERRLARNAMTPREQFAGCLIERSEMRVGLVDYVYPGEADREIEHLAARRSNVAWERKRDGLDLLAPISLRPITEIWR